MALPNYLMEIFITQVEQ